MMIFLRLMWLTVRSWRKRLPDPLAECLTRQRVWPNDLDAALHVNNGRFLTLMDLGRYDWFIRIGLMRPALKLGWRPLVGASTIRYRRPLTGLKAYRFRTRLVCWDGKWLYFEQRLESRAGELMAIAHIRKLVMSPQGVVAPAEVLAMADWTGPSPPMPRAVSNWLSWLDEL